MDRNYNSSHPADPPTPAEFADIEKRLSHMGASERAACPDGLEARVFSASMPALREAPHSGAPAPIARIGGQRWFGSMLPLAAALGLCLTAALIGLALLRGGPAPTGSPSPLAATPDMTDDGLDALESELESFFVALNSPGEAVLSIRTGVDTSEVELDNLWRSDLGDLVGMLEGSL